MDTRDDLNVYRREKLAEIECLMQEAQVKVTELLNSYSEETDGKYSAVHPAVGFRVMRKKLVELRRGFLGAKL